MKEYSKNKHLLGAVIECGVCEVHHVNSILGITKKEDFGKGTLEDSLVFLEKSGHKSLAKLLKPIPIIIEDLHCDNCNLLLAYFDEEKQISITMKVPGMCWLENKDEKVKSIYFCSPKCFDGYFGL